MTIYVATAYCWVILAASIITAVAAIVALIAEDYKDTLPECIALSMVAIAGIIVTLQIYTFGFAMGSGFAFMAASVAAFALAQLLKNTKRTRSQPRGALQ
jgi:hypothetical protein